MFSQRLENLIQAALQDGVLTEQEKAAIIKRAQAEGEDVDEVSIYVDSLLQKKQQEKNAEAERQEALRLEKKQSAYGKVCPSCGKQVPSLALVCTCGYEFKSEKATSSIRDFVEELNKTYSEEKKIELIQTFPVPNNKEDIVEFLSMAASNAKHVGGIWGTRNGRLKVCVAVVLLIFLVAFYLMHFVFQLDKDDYWIFLFDILIFGAMSIGAVLTDAKKSDIIRQNKIADAWCSKFDQVMMKGRSLRGDAEFQRILDSFEKYK